MFFLVAILQEYHYFHMKELLEYYGLDFQDLGYRKDRVGRTIAKSKLALKLFESPFFADTLHEIVNLKENVVLMFQELVNLQISGKLSGPYSLIVEGYDTFFVEDTLGILKDTLRMKLVQFYKAVELYEFYLQDLFQGLENSVSFFLEVLSEDEKLKVEDTLKKIVASLRYSELFSSQLVLLQAFIELKQAVSYLEGASYELKIGTDRGYIVITTQDEVPESSLVYINTSGNQIYRNLGCKGVRICAFMDLQGNDIYASDSTSFSGIYGAFMFYDAHGNDVYRSSSDFFNFALLGMSVLMDGEGDDFYDLFRYSLASSVMGISYFLDEQGDDTYRIASGGLGFSGTNGISIFEELDGNDVYQLGRFEEHEPLWKDEYVGMGLGFSIGYREDLGGGIALFVDRHGNDVYTCGTYCLGSGYWYSVGMFYDASGNDRYVGTEYGLGAGIHFAVGIFVDSSGDDIYVFKAGPSIGSGHDFGYGFFLDVEGNDIYHVSGGFGNSLANGLGIFLEGEGNDTYSFTEKDLSCGYAMERSRARDYMGIGLFVDFSGKDNYPQAHCQDGSTWFRGDIGIGADFR